MEDKKIRQLIESKITEFPDAQGSVIAEKILNEYPQYKEFYTEANSSLRSFTVSEQ